MRLICIGDTQKNTDGRPCKTLSTVILKEGISLWMSGREGILSTLRDFPSDVIVIQQIRPESSLIKIIRNNNFNLPILIIAQSLTALETSEVLSAGADDCVPLTIEPIELSARLNTIIRRNLRSHINSQMMRVGRLTVKEDTHEILLDDEPVMLTHGEYEIMALMIKKRGDLLNKSVILNALYTDENRPASKTIDVMVCRIRQKLKKKGIFEPFKTSWGMGYRLNEEAFFPLEAKIKNDFKNFHYLSKESSLPVTGGLNIVFPSRG
ncbi:response regulator transcription factor [Acetobacteraceae bacterium ESL0709]|nr:response regulator transcription factor [Acetobacteraceae bacterium ESL0697]MDF7679042.1 response regulator transcription factor [Acetobacteraceae bacterium ESL0709]